MIFSILLTFVSLVRFSARVRWNIFSERTTHTNRPMKISLWLKRNLSSEIALHGSRDDSFRYFYTFKTKWYWNIRNTYVTEDGCHCWREDNYNNDENVFKCVLLDVFFLNFTFTLFIFNENWLVFINRKPQSGNKRLKIQKNSFFLTNLFSNLSLSSTTFPNNIRVTLRVKKVHISNSFLSKTVFAVMTQHVV